MEARSGAGGGDRTPSQRPLVVTWCSAAKRVTRSVSAAQLEHGAQPALAAEWLRLLHAAPTAGPAVEVYGGRGFRLARLAADVAGADLAIVSAGLGWVSSSTRIPAYDLTISRGGLRAKSHSNFDPSSWWSHVVAGPFSSPPSRDLAARPRVLVCVSRAYAPFMNAALAGVPAGRLRIFGAGITDLLLPTLRSSLMPYDDRLASIGFSGTRSDFAQRALTHFLIHLPQGRSVEEDRVAVFASLEGVRPPAPWPKRRNVDDEAVREFIQEMLPTLGPRRTAMLQQLRKVHGVACEQGRFARLFAEAVTV